MIINHYSPDELADAFGIDMASVEADPAHDLGVGVSWARVAPGGRSDPHQHDETEMFVVVRGRGTVLVDGRTEPLEPGVVAVFEPFETHIVENTADTGSGEDLVFADLFWRDAARAGTQASRHAGRRRLGERPQFVFSTPPTPNGDLHLGHLSGPYLGADAYVRYQRMTGAHAWHLTGSDDYQSYVADLARRTGQEPAEVAAHYSREIAETLRLMDIPLDQYTVTDADPEYRAGLQDFFTAVVGSGRVPVRTTPALADTGGRYLYEVDVAGSCPGCGGGTNGNICEECGEPNVCADLGEPRVKRTGEPAVPAETARFTVPLHEFADDVAEHHRQGRVPARLRELARRVFDRPSLPVPVSHPSAWGVPPATADADGTDVDGQVIWVWPEMAYGFLHGIERLGRRLGWDWRAAEPDDDWQVVHFFGYDNSFYHAILYPVLYGLAHPGWSPSIDYHVNEFFLLEGSKFSTSRRHAIWGKDVLTPQTVDAIRYFLCRNRPEAERTDFRQVDFDATLADTLVGRWQAWLDGLAARVASAYGGAVPDAGVWVPEHVAFLDVLRGRLDAVGAALSADAFSLNRAAAQLDGIVADTERFAREQGHVRGDDRWADENRTTTALELAAAALLARVATPLMPRFAGRLAAALGIDDGADPRWPTEVTLVPAGTRPAPSLPRFFDADVSARDGSGADVPAAGADTASPTTTSTAATTVGADTAAPADVAATATASAVDAPASDAPVPGDAHPELTAWVRTRLDEILQPASSTAGTDTTALADLGAGSLHVVTLQYHVLDAFDVDLPLDELWAAPGPAGIAALLAEHGAVAPERVEAGT